MKKRWAIGIVFAILTVILCGCGDSSSSGGKTPSSGDKTSSGSSYFAWSESKDAADLNGDEVVDAEDYALWREFDAWRDTDEAIDYDGDRRIAYADYAFFCAFKEWKLSDDAIDLNADAKITIEDYTLFLNPELTNYVAWSASENAFDLNEDGVVDEQDYRIAEPYAPFIGTFRIVNFVKNGLTPYFEVSEFSLDDFIAYLPEIAFTVNKFGRASWSVPAEMRQELGEDWVDANAAVESAVIETMSANLSRVSVSSNRDGLSITAYLVPKDGGGYGCAPFSYTNGEDSVEVSFDIVYE